MDDGLQFAKLVDNSDKVRYTLTATGQYGRPTRDGGLMFLTGESLVNDFEEDITKYTAWHYDNVQVMVILPGAHSYEAITMAEYEQSLVKVQEVVEQSGEASEASPDEQPEVAQSGKFEVEVSAVGKPFVAYRGDSLEEAKATVAAHIGKCLRVQTRIHLPGGESFWIYPGKRANGLAWDKHEQWLSDLHAGAFDRAYARDAVNDLVLQGKHQEAKSEAKWFQERGINV